MIWFSYCITLFSKLAWVSFNCCFQKLGSVHVCYFFVALSAIILVYLLLMLNLYHQLYQTPYLVK